MRLILETLRYFCHRHNDLADTLQTMRLICRNISWQTCKQRWRVRNHHYCKTPWWGIFLQLTDIRTNDFWRFHRQQKYIMKGKSPSTESLFTQKTQSIFNSGIIELVCHRSEFVWINSCVEFFWLTSVSWEKWVTSEKSHLDTAQKINSPPFE